MVRKFLLLAIAGAMLLTFSVGATTQKANSDRAAPASSLRIDAPAKVDVGHPIKITLVVKGAAVIGGYETNLLFDTEAAEFASLIQDKKDLSELGRDVGPLGPVETSQGVSIGAFSCPVNDCVKPGKGTRAKRGISGTVELATVTVIPKRPGTLEFKLDATKVVNAAGEPVSVNSRNERFVVQVGPRDTGALRTVPETVPWKLKSLPPSRPNPFDLTGDEKITNADAMEAAVAWTLLREDGAACGDAVEDPSRDVNRDGCIDVADLQTIVANYDTGEVSGAQSASESAEKAPRSVVALTSLLMDWITPRPALAQEVSTFAVNSQADGADANVGNGTCATTQGTCTLRAAITEANLRPGPDTITFNIPGTGVRTIQLESRLPDIYDETGPTTIDGYTQPGSSPNTDSLVSNAKIGVQITSSGTTLKDGVVVTSPGNVIRGLAFFKLRKSIVLYGGGASNNTVTGDFVGTDAAGNYAANTVVFPAEGVTLQAGATNNSVGGTSAAERNVVSGNAYRGIATFGEATNSNRIINNIVGLGPAGDKRLSNLKHGIDINGGSNRQQIGGTQPGERNVVSGNGQEGVEISHEPTTTGNRVVGNFIGTNVTGNTATAYSYNGEWGVHIEDRVSANVVADNVIGNNRKGGIRTGNLTTGTVIENNRIGVSRDDSRIPNSGSGIQIDSDSSGQRVGSGNVIAYNGLDGIRIASASSDRNTITRNSIFGNKGLGIDIEPLGQPNPNDVDDADSGANEQLNFPVLDAATPQSVTGTACGGCTVEVFLADGGAGAYGEGKTLVGSSIAGADGAFEVTVNSVAEGGYVTATTTDTQGNTSEFSPNRQISNDTTAPAAPMRLTATSSQGGVTLNWADNAEPDLAGYSVYRSTTGGEPYTKITSSLLASSSYTDTKVTRANTYYYVVTASDKVGNEGGYSNEASVTLPSWSLSFDGVDDRDLIPSSSLLNATGTGQRTYELRIKTGQDVNARQFVYEEGSGKGNGFSVEIQGGRIYFNAWALGAGWDTVSASGPINPNTVYNVAGVYHQPSGEVRLYLDGVLRDTSVGAGTMKSHAEGGVLGGIQGSARDHLRASVSSGSFFNGLIDEFRVWKQARGQAEISNDMNADLTGGESGLIILYEIEEGSGTVLDDSSPNNLDGTIEGATWTTN